MNEKDPNPIEELQRQLAEIFSNPGLKVGKVTIDTEVGSEEIRPGESAAKKKSEEFHEETLKRIRSFKFKPKEIKDYLDRYVIRQDEAKKVLSVAICDHYNYVRRCIESSEVANQEYNKQNILLLGPTGVGKTYLMRTIARLIGVPFVKADATKFTETGYAGGDVEDLVRDLVKTANGNVELAQYGIVYLDEIDKIATSSAGGGHSRDVSGRGVQVNLLKLMEDAEVSLFTPMDMMGQMQAMMDVSRTSAKQMISTRHILFIVSGAFDKLAEEIKRRVGASVIGFGSKVQSEDAHDTYQYLQQATTADFIKYGFEPEFAGRVPVRVACESLSVDDLANILTSSEGSILKQYKENFRGYEIDLNIDEDAVKEIARRAHEEKTGARGLLTVLEKTFREFKFELPSSNIRNLEITEKTVKDPVASLKKLISKKQSTSEKSKSKKKA